MRAMESPKMKTEKEIQAEYWQRWIRWCRETSEHNARLLRAEGWEKIETQHGVWQWRRIEKTSELIQRK
jgi:hypothetical protein